MILRDAASVPAPGRAPGAEQYGLSSEFFQGWSDLELRPLNQALLLVCGPRGATGNNHGIGDFAVSHGPRPPKRRGSVFFLR